MVEPDTKDVAGIRVPPPVTFFALLIIGLLAHFNLPFSLEIPLAHRVVIALLALLPAGYLASSAYVSMYRHNTPFDPAKPTRSICCDGSFRITRNPLYLALVLLLLGIGLAMGSPILVLLSPVLLVIFDRLVVQKEEVYLEKKFGHDYLEYKSKVRRWV